MPRIVSITICTAVRGRWLGEPRLAAVVTEEILTLHAACPVYGYCVMPDHLHLLVSTGGALLADVVRQFKGRSSRSVRRHRPKLEVWQSGYWDHVVRRGEGLYATLLYVFMNPVRAGLVTDWWDYPWLGSPVLGEVGPSFFEGAEPETVLWKELLSREDLTRG